MVYLIVRKYQYKDQEPTYRVEKWSKTIKEANQFLSALSLLENDQYVMHFIVPAQENPALILTEEVETKANGKEINITEEMPF